MPNFSVSELEKVVNDVVHAASAPVGSALFMRTPQLIKPIVMDGDVGDGWILTSGLCQAVIQLTGADRFRCQCTPTDPDHRPVFGLAPVVDGKPDWDLSVLPDREPPLELGITNPEVVTYTRMLNAEFADDEATSVAAWEQAVEGGWFAKVILLAARQAGEVRRSASAMGGAN